MATRFLYVVEMVRGNRSAFRVFDDEEEAKSLVRDATKAGLEAACWCLNHY